MRDEVLAVASMWSRKTFWLSCLRITTFSLLHLHNDADWTERSDELCRLPLKPTSFLVFMSLCVGLSGVCVELSKETVA